MDNDELGLAFEWRWVVLSGNTLRQPKEIFGKKRSIALMLHKTGHVQKSFRFWITCIVLCSACCSCKKKAEQAPSNVIKAESVDKSKALEIASQKAGELGYNVKDMTVETSKNGDVFSVYFSPKGTSQLGGDLTVMIDAKTQEIVEIQRGQ